MPGGHFTVLRGNPTPEELAAAVTVLLTLAATAQAAAQPTPRTTRPHWHSRRRITHARGRHLPPAAWTGVGSGPWRGAGR